MKVLIVDHYFREGKFGYYPGDVLTPETIAARELSDEAIERERGFNRIRDGEAPDPDPARVVPELDTILSAAVQAQPEPPPPEMPAPEQATSKRR